MMSNERARAAPPSGGHPHASSLSRETLDHLSEGCQIIGFDWRYLYLNPAAARHGRLAAEDLVGRTMAEAYPGIEETPLFGALRRCMDDRAVRLLENEFSYADGERRWFELRIEPVPEGIFVLSLDITERKRTERALTRANRALAMLSDCNQALVRATSEQRLLQDVCDRIVASGAYARVWVGVREEGGAGEPGGFASAGLGDEDGLRARGEWAEALEGRGAAGAALRVGAAAPRVDPTPLDASEGSAGSTFRLALPLPGQAAVRGVLTLYARDDAFDETERSLLDELAGDLAFGIASIRRERARARAEERVRHLNAVLAGIRGVNQLIVREVDPQSLIDRACALLVACRGYETCTIVLPDHAGRRLLADAGAPDKLSSLRRRLATGELPSCVARALGATRVYEGRAGTPRCEACTAGADCGFRPGTVAVALRSDERTHGALLVSAPASRAADEEEEALLLEIAGDLAFALRGMELAGERERLDRELRRSDERFRELFSRLASGVAVFEPVDGGRDFVFRDLNAAGEAVGRVDREAVLGRRLTEVFPAVGEAGLLAVLRKVLDTGAAVREPATRYRDERISEWLELHAYRLSSGEVVAIADDVTDLRRTEEQLRQSQKLEAIGRLAGGVAHDFNNMLSVVLCNAEFLSAELPDGDRRREDAEQILQAAHRAAALTRQLLAFSRQQVLSPEPLDLNEVIAGMEKLVRRLLGEHIAVHVALGSGPVRVRADRGQLEQVIMNLAVNARDAMPSGGTLRLETTRLEVPAGGGAEVPGGTGIHAVVSVTDTGHGMDPATQARIFEPFFTTKPRGKGTGLGLATVHGIVQQSGGSIWIDSEVGRGTTFKILLPEIAESPRSVAVPAAATSAYGRETILLVEDEAAVRRAVSAILRRHGYELLEAASAADALALVSRGDRSLHLVMTDVVMPGSSGLELARSLAAVRPDLPVLFVSGYTDESVLAELIESGADFLQKPLTQASLTRKIREILERAGDRG